MSDTESNKFEWEKNNFTWENNSDNESNNEIETTAIPDNCLADCLAWWGLVGATASAIAAAPATAMICIGISIFGIGMHVASITSCDECIPNEFPHQD